jgi:ABC-2 type transport system ATP-binding protein
VGDLHPWVEPESSARKPMKQRWSPRSVADMLTNSLDAAVAQRPAASSPQPAGPRYKQRLTSEHDASARADKARAGAPVISVHALGKRYGEREAVRGIDLEVSRGEIFAFLGPNGAGKTTTVEILEGFRRPSSGTVQVLGAEPWRAPSAWRERIGIVLQESEAEPGLTVRECLALYAGYYRAPRGVEETLALVGLDEQAAERATALSGGQRRRLDVALALIGDPELIFLDEPTTGFDPAARRAAWEVIGGLRELGKTVFLTTHYMEEAERLADRIAIIADGRIIAEGTPQTLGERQTAEAQITFTLPSGARAGDLPGSLAERTHECHDGGLTLQSASVAADLHVLSGWALERRFELDDLEVRRPSLEDVYLQLTANDQQRSQQ